MLEGLQDHEQKEAWAVVQALDAASLVLSDFDAWLKAERFEIHHVGKYFTHKGTSGYVQVEFAMLGGESVVVWCGYIPYSDTTKTYALVKEGVSASGKSLSQKELDLLKSHRYKQVEYTVTATIGEETGQQVEPHINLRDDLELDEELDIPEIVAKLEDEFDCIIPDEDAKRFRTVEDLIAFIREEKGLSP
jgi:acyl carrier protein